MKLPIVKVDEINHFRAGEIVRTARIKAGISLRNLARRMDFSAPFVSDLELGRRNWTRETFNLALETIKKIKSA
jgi:transcriptional regulator with XRE-family HTH domain